MKETDFVSQHFIDADRFPIPKYMKSFERDPCFSIKREIYFLCYFINFYFYRLGESLNLFKIIRFLMTRIFSHAWRLHFQHEQGNFTLN